MIRHAILAVAMLVLTALPASAKTVDVPATVALILDGGDSAIAAYTPERKAATADAMSDLYFDSFEASGLEGAIGMVDASWKIGLEGQFGQLIGKIRQGDSPEGVKAGWASLRANLAVVPSRMAPKGGGFWSMFLQSFLILVREGFEAMLVITSLVAYLKRSAPDKVKVVYHGVGWAVLASLATAWAVSTLLNVSGQGKELFEGCTMLLASVILFYCSYWLFAKREAARWQSYVKEQISSALSGGRLFALGFAAFLAVYREGAETVLFYIALAAGEPGQLPALLAGLGAACVALAALYVAMNVMSIRLPLGVFFGVTAGLLYYLALAFAGKGVVELQNAKVLPITPLEGWPSVDWLGLFPTLEGAAAQGVLIVPLLVGLLILQLKKRAMSAA
ncbi:iron permease [Paramagnetospirillum kuznetsovii]|uniref:Iron permease n=1 Tax=Paramagnetospirillum kuznetsovii TaxID=2053833 RepID=A0A364NTE5_9PROT|nr:FTR1 family protein [Paramagnetospirillum kuznetsovii]RAU20359.1 iron permease [Paramagnetospirillum kuznetsovii]